MNGDGIYLISPSSAVADPAPLARACERLQALGFATTVDASALAVEQRFAGTDEARLATIARSLTQPHATVMATRGGYGLSRLLPYIDWQAVAASGKRFVGFSDFTLFNLALLARTGAVSYSGPTAIADFGGEECDDFTVTHFCEVMRNRCADVQLTIPDADLHTVSLDCCGTLWGGNLETISALVGTPYFPDVHGGILFLEDVCEHPYRIERRLAQLWQAGVLQRQRAILLGAFTDYRLAAHDNGYDLPAVIAWLRRTVDTPVVCGLPTGHVATKATLPVGGRVRLVVESGMAQLCFL